MTKREASLLRLIWVLWNELRRIPFVDTDQLEANIRQAGLGWALPESVDHLDDDDWLTPGQIAHELGYEVATVHVWVHRYELRAVKGTYRWGDVKAMRAQRRRE